MILQLITIISDNDYITDGDNIGIITLTIIMMIKIIIMH